MQLKNASKPCASFSTQPQCRECDRLRVGEELPPSVRKLRAMRNNAVKGNRLLGAPLPDFDLERLRARVERLGFRSELTGHPIVLEQCANYMASLDRFPDSSAPYMEDTTRVIEAEFQLHSMGSSLPVSNDIRIAVEACVRFHMGLVDEDALKAHEARWLAARFGADVERQLYSRLEGNKHRDTQVPGRPTEAGLGRAQAWEKARRQRFCCKYSHVMVYLDAADSYFQFSLDRIDNALNHTDDNTVWVIFLFNSSGNARNEGGICWSELKFLKFVLKQTVFRMETDQAAAIQARIDVLERGAAA